MFPRGRLLCYNINMLSDFNHRHRSQSVQITGIDRIRKDLHMTVQQLIDLLQTMDRSAMVGLCNEVDEQSLTLGVVRVTEEVGTNTAWLTFHDSRIVPYTAGIEVDESNDSVQLITDRLYSEMTQNDTINDGIYTVTASR